MKPKFDLKNPIVKKIIDIYRLKSMLALGAEQTVESAVIPIYHLSDRRPTLEQIASGIIVKIKDEYFILSASHVFDQIGDYALCTGVGDGEKVIQLPGERFSSPKGSSGTHSDDEIDASAYHIQCNIPEKLKKLAITMDDFDTQKNDNGKDLIMYLAAGFRIKKSNTAGNAIRSKREAFSSIEVNNDCYGILGLDSSTHIVLDYGEQVLVDDRWQLSPIPKGFSGGAIIKVVPIKTTTGVIYKQKLTGIITEHRKKTEKIDGVLIGTRADVHLACIKKYMSDLLSL